MVVTAFVLVQFCYFDLEQTNSRGELHNTQFTS